MTEKVGIKNLEEMGDFIVAGANAVLKASADGKYEVADFQHLMPMIPLVTPAFEGVTEIPAELKDLSSEEGQKLVIRVMTGLAVDEPKAKEAIDKSLKFLVAGYDFVIAMKNLKA